jgi:hypothetical protein
MTTRAIAAMAAAASTIAIMPIAAARRARGSFPQRESRSFIPSPLSRAAQAQNPTIANERLVTADIIGSAAALLLGAFAYLRSRARGGFYDREVYGMTAATHRAYAAISLVFSGAFAVAAGHFADAATVWIYAAFVLFGIFYLTSYLRGAQEDDE